MCHWPLISRVFIFLKFLLVSFHFIRICRLVKNSILHLDQNSVVMSWTHFHVFLQYRSALWKVLGGGITTLVFIVSMLLGRIGNKLFESLTVSTVKGLELRTALTSVINLLRLSSSKLFPCVFVKVAITFLADLICLSQIPPCGLQLVDYVSILSSLSHVPGEMESISWEAFHSSIWGPTKLLPSSDLSILIFPRLAMNILRTWIKESVSIVFATSRWTVLLAK